MSSADSRPSFPSPCAGLWEERQAAVFPVSHLGWPSGSPMAIRSRRLVVPPVPGVLVKAAARKQWSWAPRTKVELPGRPGESGLGRGTPQLAGRPVGL